MTAVLPAHADLFTVTGRPAAQDFAADTFGFRIGEGVQTNRDSRTFSSIAGAAGLRPLLPAGEAGGVAGAGARRPAAGPANVLESALWLTIGVGVILIGVVKLRVPDGPG
ncbi:MAG TPA: hypothetical protein VFU53_13415 [Burkholderiales bacterium]|nr:hypothetical protein [Burkholderiales bacterium]